MNIQMTSPFGWDASLYVIPEVSCRISSECDPYSVTDWMTVQSKCGVTFNNTIPAGLLFDDSSPAASNGTSYNVTAYECPQDRLFISC